MTEHVVDGADGLRFLARAQTGPDRVPALLRFILNFTRNRGGVLIRMREGGQVPTESLVEALAGNDHELALTRDLGARASHENTVVAVPFGRFDDREAGLFLCAPSRWTTEHPDLGLPS